VEMAGDDEAVAAVVAGAAADRDRLPLGVEAHLQLGSAAAGVLHEHDAGNAELPGGAGVQFAHLGTTQPEVGRAGHGASVRADRRGGCNPTTRPGRGSAPGGTVSRRLRTAASRPVARPRCNPPAYAAGFGTGSPGRGRRSASTRGCRPCGTPRAAGP